MVVTDIETLPDATVVMHQAVSILLGEELPGAGNNPEIMAGFAMLTERVIASIDEVREEEITLLRALATTVERSKIPVTSEVTTALGAWRTWKAHT